jgi:hypothetical protein
MIISRLKHVALFACLLIAVESTVAQVDSNTLLSLKFENSLDGEQGEVPVQASGLSFLPGTVGQSVSVPPAGVLVYSAANNVSAQHGTIEFWLRPNWNGNDNQTHTLVDWGGAGVGGMRIDKHGLNKLALAMDTFGTWRTIELDVSNWVSGQWHYLAFTYSNTTKTLQIYVDAELRNSVTFTGNLPVISTPNFQIGGAPGGANPLNGQIDEFRISDRVRSSAEIRNGFYSGVVVNSITLATFTRKIWPTWKVKPTVTLATSIGTLTPSPEVLNWTSSNPSAVSVNASGELTGSSGGSSTVTAMLNGKQATLEMTVQAPARAPRVDIPTGNRAEPATNSLYEVPVVSLRYLPTADGVNLDTTWSPGYFGLEPTTLANLEQGLDRYDEILKYMAEEGSRFRGYGSKSPVPSVGYRIVATITVYEPPPPGRQFDTFAGLPAPMSDMFQIFDRLGLASYIEQQGVKEIWYWTKGVDPRVPSYNPAIHPPENIRSDPETNMASPTTGDISNSNRDNTDLPMLSKTYVVRFQDSRRLDSLTLHIDGHQWEQMLVYVDFLRDGNNHLFWRSFVGYSPTNVFQQGRGGWTHYPPNSDTVANPHSDYNNYVPVDSDIKDWRPDGSGQKQAYSAAVPRDIPYSLPFNFLPDQRAEMHWYVFWRQSMPGFGNTIPYQLNGNQYKMTNWWQFQGDWDRAIQSGVGLYEPANCNYVLSASAVNVPAGGSTGSISVTAPSGCKWFATNINPWAVITSGDLGNGSGTLNFSVAANSSGAQRKTRIIVAGQAFNITQAGSAVAPAVSGVVTYGTAPAGPTARFVPGVLLTAAGASPANASSNASGAYILNGLGAGSYTVTPTKTGDVNGSISGLDAARVAQHVAGLIALTPNQQIAGDATNNGGLSGLDAARIAQFAAGLANPGIAGQWKFLPGSKTYQSVANSLSGENYEAILVGDVTGNWTAPAAGARPGDSPGGTDSGTAKANTGWVSEFEAASPDAVEVSLAAGLRSGSSLTVPIAVGDTTGKGVLAYDFTVMFDPNVLRPAVDPADTAGTLSNGWTVVHNTQTPGEIRVTAFGTAGLIGKGVLLNLRFETIGRTGSPLPVKLAAFQMNEEDVNPLWGSHVSGLPFDWRVSGQGLIGKW